MRTLLVVYDNGSYIHDFPHSIAYIAAAIRETGQIVKIYNQDIHHYPDEHLTEYLNNNHFDTIGIGVIAGYYQYRKVISLCKAINASKDRPTLILGGHGPTPDPEFFFEKTGADFIVMGEGEETIVDLLYAIQLELDFHDVPGIAFKQNGETIINERRTPIKNINNISIPAYDLFPMELYRLARYPHTNNSEFSMSMLSGRGCIFSCTFCYRLDKGFRPRSNESIIKEMKYLRDTWGITNIYFFDELLMVSPERTIKLSYALKEANLGMKWSCNGRLNFAKHDVLQIMKDAGCVFINYGIEAMDDLVLKNMKKGLTVDLIKKGIENTLDVGISPGLNLMWGNIGDTKETLQKAVDFLLKYDDGEQLRTIRFMTPYPGAPIYYDCIKKGLIKDCEDFYENKHLNSDLLCVNLMKNLSDEEAHKLLCEANKTLLKNYYKHKLDNMIYQTNKLYLEKDVTFRGYRQ